MKSPDLLGFSIYKQSARGEATPPMQSIYLKTPAIILENHGDGAPITMSAHSSRSLTLNVGCWYGWVMEQT